MEQFPFLPFYPQTKIKKTTCNFLTSECDWTKNRGKKTESERGDRPQAKGGEKKVWGWEKVEAISDDAFIEAISVGEHLIRIPFPLSAVGFPVLTSLCKVRSALLLVAPLLLIATQFGFCSPFTPLKSRKFTFLLGISFLFCGGPHGIFLALRPNLALFPLGFFLLHIWLIYYWYRLK